MNSIKQTGKRLNLSDRSVYHLMEQGKLVALKLGSRTVISDAELDRFERSLPVATFKPRWRSADTAVNTPLTAA